MDDIAPVMADILVPYLEIDGVITAALVSADGLLVSAAGDHELNLEALAAYAAAAMSSATRLADELDVDPPKSIVLDLTGRDLVLAPVSTDIFLLLVRNHEILPAGGS